MYRNVLLRFINCLGPKFDTFLAERIQNRRIFLFFSAVCFQMSSQSAGMGSCIVTLVALVGLFSTVCFQMCPQIAFLNGCKVTLVTFICLFPTVCFQMCPQIASLGGCKVTLVTFV